MKYLITGKTPLYDIIYFIEPGETYSAGEIIIRGNYRTKDKVIRREVKIAPGDKITSDKLQKSFNNLYDLNYFDKITYILNLRAKDCRYWLLRLRKMQKQECLLIGGRL
jgi:outer membrane protein assembly factor BamA